MGMYDCPVQGDPPPWEYEYRVLVAADRRRTYSPKVLYSSHARQEGAREANRKGVKKPQAVGCGSAIRGATNAIDDFDLAPREGRVSRGEAWLRGGVSGRYSPSSRPKRVLFKVVIGFPRLFE